MWGAKFHLQSFSRLSPSVSFDLAGSSASWHHWLDHTDRFIHAHFCQRIGNGGMNGPWCIAWRVGGDEPHCPLLPIGKPFRTVALTLGLVDGVAEAFGPGIPLAMFFPRPLAKPVQFFLNLACESQGPPHGA